MDKTLQILWLGGVFDEATMLSSPAVSPAANRWQMGLITALQNLNVPITVLSHLPNPLWPKGRFRLAHGVSRPSRGLDAELIDYWNIPFLRDLSLFRSHRSALDDAARFRGPNTVLITYNADPSYVSTGLYAKHNLGMPWVCLVADGEAPEGADGWIFLSWKCFEEWCRKPTLHLDGGVSECRLASGPTTRSTKSSGQAVMYSGAMTKHGGVDLLVKAFQTAPALAAELWLCGNGSSPLVDELSAKDRRIRHWGFVEEDRLREYYQKACLFVNPRPSALACNKKNYPSKLLEYLSYGKPVISTFTDGLSPEYRDVLVIIEEETPECLAANIERVLGWTSQQREAMQARIAKFLSTHLWSFQAERLINWLRDLQKHNRR